MTSPSKSFGPSDHWEERLEEQFEPESGSSGGGGEDDAGTFPGWCGGRSVDVSVGDSSARSPESSSSEYHDRYGDLSGMSGVGGVRGWSSEISHVN